jgi:AcrR family transcriptional regulator
MARPHKALRDQTMTETRQRLLDAAAVEFGSEGYPARISAHLDGGGLHKGTVYNHFDSKRAAAGPDRQVAAARPGDQHPSSRPPIVGRLEQFFRAGFEFVEQHPERARVMINLIYGPDEDIKQIIYRAYEPLFDLLIHGIIGVGMEQGVFRPADPGVTSALVMTITLEPVR